MLFETPEQFVILAVVLLGGVLIGYASAPNPKKWKRRARTQSIRFAAYHADAEDRLRAANQRAADLRAEAEALRIDHAEAERTIAALRGAAAVAPVARAASGPALALVDTTPVEPPPQEWIAKSSPGPALETKPGEPIPPQAAPEPSVAAASEMPDKAWRTGTSRDDLTRLRGIDGVLDNRLSDLGVVRFEDLENLSAEDEMALEQRLQLPAGYIVREQWRAEAALLRAARDRDLAARFNALEALPAG